MGTVKGRELLDGHRECLYDRYMLGVKDLVKGHLYGLQSGEASEEP